MSSSSQAGAIIAHQFIALIELCGKHCRCFWERRENEEILFLLAERRQIERHRQTCNWQYMNKSRCVGGTTRSSFSMEGRGEDIVGLSCRLFL